jgi:hemerythrin superfamily protein
VKDKSTMSEPASETAVAHDVIDLLIGQHMTIRDLFVDVMNNTGDARRNAFEELVRLLAVHETAEEQLVHPLARGSVHGDGDVVDDRLAEEREAKETLVELERMGPDAPEFDELFARFRLDVLQHAHNEETYEFRYLRAKVPAAQLKAMAPMLRAAEAVAPTHPHPGAESGTATNLTGPALSLFDRTKDLVRSTFRSSDDQQ